MRKLIILLTSLFVNICYSQVTFTLNTNVCSGVTNTLTANTGTDIALSYTWAVLPSLPVFSSPNSSVTTINFTNSGTYTISLNVTLSTGFGSYSSTVNVTQTPTITIAQSASTICITKNFPKYSKLVTFTASGSSAPYTWSPLTNVMGPNNSIAWGSPIFPVCYTAMSAVGSCTGAAAACITITPQFPVYTTPYTPTVCLSDSTQLFVYSNSTIAALPLQKYVWYDPIPISITNASVNPATFSPSVTSTYTFEAIDNNGCISFPQLVTISVLSCTGIRSNSLDERILSIYPNPSNEQFNIEFDHSMGSDSFTKIEIINSFGQIIQEEAITFNDNKTIINTKELANGVYVLKLFNTAQSDRSATISKRFVIAK
jgi:hypothetical protein